MPGGREKPLTCKTLQLHVPVTFLLELLSGSIKTVMAVNGAKMNAKIENIKLVISS